MRAEYTPGIDDTAQPNLTPEGARARGGFIDDADLLTRYNYDEFVREKFEPWMRFHESPRLGTRAPDFPLWELDGNETRLSTIWSRHLYTIVEFGSFT